MKPRRIDSAQNGDEHGNHTLLFVDVMTVNIIATHKKLG